MSTIHRLKLNELSKIFTTKTFDAGTDEERTIYAFSENVSDEIKKKFYELEIQVDDYHYKWLHLCLSEYISELKLAIGMDTQCVNFEKIEYSIATMLEADIYNRDLLDWLSSNLLRSYYLEDVLKLCEFDSLWQYLQTAQLDEMHEVYQIGFAFVRWYLENEDE